MPVLGPGLLSERETWKWSAVVCRTWGRSEENQHCDPLVAAVHLISTQKAWLDIVAAINPILVAHMKTQNHVCHLGM